MTCGCDGLAADGAILESLRVRVAAAVRIPVEVVVLDLDRDLLSVDGYEVAGHVLDSLTLVDLVGSLEDEYDVSLQALLDRGEPLTLRSVLIEVSTQGATA